MFSPWGRQQAFYLHRISKKLLNTSDKVLALIGRTFEKATSGFVKEKLFLLFNSTSVLQIIFENKNKV